MAYLILILRTCFAHVGSQTDETAFPTHDKVPQHCKLEITVFIMLYSTGVLALYLYCTCSGF